ncbi:MAG: RIP metalloprotease RseP [Geminicoccaceae bacterium]|nr:RIP metalloprotease RseP [Geminicoccaceae bacterium]MCS7268320.1 RIP metalloprotease RseP [Geminicoccaceae bacterium]MCX7629206.1 RIP metalloprotease RseP [Geminicoccaceae bacterium]MDW8124629.1 RIP metalloprotease RseP [Geminicoccaceae bacterium]MDW8341315.1 RIP metalloprotease RseP [Geminicoccaceae bacterium]
MDLLGLVGQYLIPFLIILSIVVFVHEWGHYRVARAFGVRVEVFSIGFGPELFGFTDRRGTRWKISAIPLGGYVKMLGDADATSSTIDVAAIGDPESFPAQTVGRRAAIVAAGPLANFLFAVLLLAVLFVVSGRPFTPAEIGAVQPESPAASAGLRPGDRVLAVDGRTIESFEELQTIVRASPGIPLVFTILREGRTFERTVTPAPSEFQDRFGNVHRIGLIGVSRAGIEFKRSGPGEALWEATAETARMIGATLKGLAEMLVGARGTQELGGPLRIAQMSGEIARDGLVPALWFTAVLSINLGLINLFPIPMLDGGHLALYAVEAVRGRPLTERSQEIAFRLGLAMVLSLMLFATWNDIVHLKIVEFITGLIS